MVVCAAVVCVTLATGGAEGAVASAWSPQRTPNPAGARIQRPLGCVVLVADGLYCRRALHQPHRRGGDARGTLERPYVGDSTDSEARGRQDQPPVRGLVCVDDGVHCRRERHQSRRHHRAARGTLERHPLGDPADPRPAAANGRVVSYLGSVSCASTRACAAVGYSGNSLGTTGVTLAERWNGTSWAIERTPHPAGATVGFLSGVSCVSPRSCTAVGFFVNRVDGGRALAERWNGSTWKIERTPDPVGATDAQLADVSCAPSGPCTAVGFFGIITGLQVMLAEHWNGTRWAIQWTRYPVGATGVQFTGVSCASPRSCSVVGFFTDINGSDAMLVERWDGRSWTIQPTPHPIGASSNSLEAVSCTSTTACTAVGGFVNRAGTGKALAERYS